MELIYYMPELDELIVHIMVFDQDSYIAGEPYVIDKYLNSDALKIYVDTL